MGVPMGVPSHRLPAVSAELAAEARRTARLVAATIEPPPPIDRRTGKPKLIDDANRTGDRSTTYDAAFFERLEMFARPEGGFVGENAALADFLADALEKLEAAAAA